MSQDKIKINGTVIRQPDEKLVCSFETTYTEDSTRTQDGKGHFTRMFTVEQLSYTATHVSVKDASQILKFIIKGEYFILHYYSLYYNEWRDDTFYVGKGNFTIGTLSENNEYISSLSFNMTGVNPL